MKCLKILTQELERLKNRKKILEKLKKRKNNKKSKKKLICTVNNQFKHQENMDKFQQCKIQLLIYFKIIYINKTVKMFKMVKK